jgi:serine/threonine protein kinase
LKKLTHGLRETYVRIKKKQAREDEEVPIEHIFKEGTVIRGQYRFIRYIGRGVFGMVIQAIDINNNEKVAIKVIRDRSNCGDSRFREQAKSEIEILKFINKIDHDKGFVVRLIDHF